MADTPRASPAMPTLLPPPPPGATAPAALKGAAAPSRNAPLPAPPPVVSPRLDNEEQATRDVNARLAYAGRLIDQIDPVRLAKEQREMLSGIQDFISKAVEALQAKDLPRAHMLADKASKLADDLAAALKTSK